MGAVAREKNHSAVSPLVARETITSLSLLVAREKITFLSLS